MIDRSTDRWVDVVDEGEPPRPCPVCGEAFQPDPGLPRETCGRYRCEFVQVHLRDFWNRHTIEKGSDEAFEVRVGMTRADWEARRAELLGQIGQPGDDAAIVELVDLDPRMLADEYIIARIVRARLASRVALVDHTFLGERGNTEIAEARQSEAVAARDFLTDLGGRLRNTGVGRGARPRVLLSRFRWVYGRNLAFAREIAELPRKHPDDSEEALQARAREIAKVRDWLPEGDPAVVPEYHRLKPEAVRKLLRLDVRRKSGPAPVEAAAALLTRADLGLTEKEFEGFRRRMNDPTRNLPE